MEKKQNLLRTKKKETKSKDPCPVCEEELYFNSRYSRRIGIFDTLTPNHNIIGWACPHCDTEFDKMDNIMYIYGQDFIQGKS